MPWLKATLAAGVLVLTTAVSVVVEYFGDKPPATMLALFGTLLVLSVVAVVAHSFLQDKPPPPPHNVPAAAAGADPFPQPPAGSVNTMGGSGSQIYIGGHGQIGEPSGNTARIVALVIAGFVGVAMIIAATVVVLSGSETKISGTVAIAPPSQPAPVVTFVRVDSRPDSLVGGIFDDSFH